ncbi:MAG: sulfite reductase subunit alpha [Methylacidiphilales bacterium]|nr:sulfite reductase subunit alpha [Candidatus Methylacidiphilales bacterium]
MSTPTPPSPYNRTNPFKARITENYSLNNEGSAKDTRHIVIHLGSSGIAYVPGDSLGVVPRNFPQAVDELISHLAIDPATLIEQPAGAITFRDLLINQYIINRVSKKFVKALWEKLPEGEKKTQLGEIVNNDEALTDYIFTRDYTDVLIEYPVKLTALEFIPLINKIAPRLYSIASSPKAHPGEVHLTVAVVNYTTHGRAKYGLASGYLGHGQELNQDEVPVYIQPTKHFHMPPSDANIIMVGPGTGIAPFRAFLEERAIEGAKGRNWLFFGDQKRASDFLYEKQLTDLVSSGVLTRLDTAFSRDQAEKIYVQNRMYENAAELWKWLKDGAYFYVCGDAKRMAKDVHQMLIDIAQQQGGLSPEAAREYIEVTLSKTEKRYLKDVY